MTEQTAKIIFVDDKKSILNSLKKILKSENWQCHFVTSAKAALDMLATEKADLLVTATLMPDMDGIELANEVQQKYPEIIRILLADTGSEPQANAALAAGSAQQIIPKPWIDQELREIIRSALRQSAQQKKYSPEFQVKINSIPLLPSLPNNYTRIQDCILAEDVDFEKMAVIIGQDVAMTSTLLKWANSALFEQRYRVDTIKKAIVVLGTDIVTNLILSDAVSKSLATAIPQVDGFDLKSFNRHSIATAILARLLIKSLYASNSELQDRAFIAGLLHDMGKLISACHFTDQFAAALHQTDQQSCELIEAETSTLGLNHAELGGYLAEWWSLPHFIVNAIQLHHEPKISPVDPEVVNAVYLANLISYRIGYGCNGEKVERKINQEIWDKFYLTEDGLEILRKVTETTLQLLDSGVD
jgi:HD-like signal output (HDOD) protein